MDFQMRKKLSLGVMVFAIFAGSIILPASAQTQVNTNKLCFNSYLNKIMPLCPKVIAGANSWEQAASWSSSRVLRVLERQVTPLLQTIDAKLLPTTPLETKAAIVKKCKSSYGDVVEAILKVRTFTKSDYYGEFHPNAIYASQCFKDCRESVLAVNGQPEIPELNRFNTHIDRLIDVLLVLESNRPDE